MIKLTDLLKEEETFTATSKKSGETSVFKSKDSRDAAVKAGTHSKIDKDSEEDDKSKKEKPNMFSKDTGYDAPDTDDSDDEDDDYEIDNSDEDTIELPKEVEAEFEKELGSVGYDWADIGAIPGVISYMDGDENAIMISTGAAYGGDEPFYVSGYNLPDMEDGDTEETNGKSFDTKEDAMAYAKELAQKLKGGDSKEEPKKDLDSFYDADDFQNSVDNLKGKISDEDYEEIKDNLEGLKNLQYDLEDIDRDEDNEEWGMQQDIIDAEVDDLKGLIKQATSKSEPKSEPTKDSTKERAGNPKVNKVVSGKAKKLGITPQKLGKEEYEKRMTQAAVEALTDANFHSEARALIAKLEGKPEWAEKPTDMPDISSDEYDEWRKNSVYSSTFYDSSEGTDDIAHSATGESGWDGIESLDAIAYDLKMNGSKKLAAKLQSIFEGTTKKGFKNHRLKNLI